MSKEVVQLNGKNVTNIYTSKLTKLEIFNLSQVATPVGDVLDQKLHLLGVHHKVVSTADKGDLILTILFVNEDGEIKTYFSSAVSFMNGLEEIAAVFGAELESGKLVVEVSQVKTRNDNSVYKITV